MLQPVDCKSQGHANAWPNRDGRVSYPCICMALAFSLILGTSPGYGQSIKVIDLRLMLLAHPLFQQFSPMTRRFTGTTSEFIAGGEIGIKQFEKNTADLERELETLLGSWQKRWQQCRTAAERRNLEESFLRERKSLEKRIDLARNRLENARQVPGQPGLTHGKTIVPQIMALEADLKKAALRVQKNFGGPVIDISHLQPSPWVQPDMPILMGKRNFHWAKPGHAVIQPDLDWIHQAKALLLKQTLSFSPVPLGAVDGREEAVQAVRSVTRGGGR